MKKRLAKKLSMDSAHKRVGSRLVRKARKTGGKESGEEEDNSYHALIESLEPSLTAVIPFLTVRDVARLSCVCRILHRWTCADVLWRQVCQTQCRYASLLQFHLAEECATYYQLAVRLAKHKFNPVKVAAELGTDCVSLLTSCLQTMVAVVRDTALSKPSVLEYSSPASALFHTEWLFRCCVSLRNDRHHVLPQGLLCQLFHNILKNYCDTYGSSELIPLKKRTLRWLVSEWWVYEYILSRLTMLSQKIDDHNYQYEWTPTSKSSRRYKLPPAHAKNHPHYASFLGVAQTCLRGSSLPSGMKLGFNRKMKLEDYSLTAAGSGQHTCGHGCSHSLADGSLSPMDLLSADTSALAAACSSCCGSSKKRCSSHSHTGSTISASVMAAAGCGERLSKQRRKTLLKLQKSLASQCPLNAVVNRSGVGGCSKQCTCGGSAAVGGGGHSHSHAHGASAIGAGVSSEALDALDLSCQCWLCALGIDLSQYKGVADMQSHLKTVSIVATSTKKSSRKGGGGGGRMRVPKLNALPPYLAMFAKSLLRSDTRAGIEHWQQRVRECVGRKQMRLVYEACIVFDSVGIEVPTKWMPASVVQRDFYKLSSDRVTVTFKDKRYSMCSAAASVSPYFREFMGANWHSTVDLSWIEGDGVYVEKVIAFCEHFVKDPMPAIPTPVRSHNLKKVTTPFYAKFAQECDRKDCFVMILIGNGLAIAPLVHLFCARIATMIKSLRPEDVREIMALETNHLDTNHIT